MMLKSLFPIEVKLHNTIDAIGLQSYLSSQKRQSIEQTFFFAKLGSSQSHSEPFGEPPKRYFQRIPRNQRSKNSINNTELIEFI